MERLPRAEDYLDRRQAPSKSRNANERTFDRVGSCEARKQLDSLSSSTSHFRPHLKLFRPQHVAILPVFKGILSGQFGRCI
jgi:hypothetical protein